MVERDSMQDRAYEAVAALLADVECSSRLGIGTHPLRSYQVEPVRAVLRSVRERLLDRARACPLTMGVTSHEGYKVQLGQARVVYLSAEAKSSVRGETASLLLVCNEMQDVSAAKWESEFVPMAASTNATRLYVGTVKTSRTLLAQKIRELRALEAEDGIQRVFVIDWERVARDNPAYGAFVRGEIAKKGQEHPSIKTEFRLLEVDDTGGLFPTRRRELMRGSHARLEAPVAGEVYAAVLDVGGEVEGPNPPAPFPTREGGAVGDGAWPFREGGASGDGAWAIADGGPGAEARQPGRDYTVCHVVAVDLAGLRDPLCGRPRYRVVQTRAWYGTPIMTLLAQLRSFLEPWQPHWIVADATGMGHGLVSLLGSPAVFGDRVVPFVFSGVSKARLGSAFLAVVETGRFAYYADDDADARAFWRECTFCQYAVPEGEGAFDRSLRWGVPDGTRDQATGELVHDDRLMAAALVAVLDEQEWTVYRGGGTVTSGRTVAERLAGEGF